eukprot:gene7805-9993_t
MKSHLIKAAGVPLERVHVTGSVLTEAILQDCQDEYLKSKPSHTSAPSSLSSLQSYLSSISSLFWNVRVREGARSADRANIVVGDRYVLLSSRLQQTSRLETDVMVLAAREVALHLPHLLVLLYVDSNLDAYRPATEGLPFDRTLSHIRSAIAESPNVILLQPPLLAHYNLSQWIPLVRGASLCVTDADISVEAALVTGTPLLIIGDESDRMEPFEAGLARRLPARKAELVRAIRNHFDNTATSSQRRWDTAQLYSGSDSSTVSVYGDNMVSRRISALLCASISADCPSPDEQVLSPFKYTPPGDKPPLPRLVKDQDAALRAIEQFTVDKHPSTLFRLDRIPFSLTVILLVNDNTTQTPDQTRNRVRRQILSVYAQTVVENITEILVYQNGDEVDLEGIDLDLDLDGPVGGSDGRGGTAPARPPVHVIQSSSYSFHGFGRLTLPLMVETEFTLFLDEAVLPGAGWAAFAMEQSVRAEAVVGSRGVIVGRNTLFVVDAPVDYALEVDYVSGAWLIRSEWSQLLWGQLDDLD